MYRLMFSDLDETLLVNHHVPKMNQEAILKAREQGLKFVPCTGRAFNMIPDILKEIGTYDKAGEYSLCFNGGLIVENKDNKVLHFKGLDFKQAKEIFEKLKAKKIYVRYFNQPGIDNYLRISVGTDEQMDKLIQALSDIVA